jgi:hypothetical protein
MGLVSSRPAAESGVGALLLVGHVLVAHASYGDDPVLVSLAQLAAQARDVDVHGAAVADVVVAPHVGHQLLARVHLVGAQNEMGQQLELKVGEVEFPAVDASATCRAVSTWMPSPAVRGAGGESS